MANIDKNGQNITTYEAVCTIGIASGVQQEAFMSKFLATKWPQRMESALRTAGQVVKDLKKRSVLISCKSGTGSSAVISSLAQLLIDPFYHTFEGFRTLIYKEWVLF